MVIPEFESFVLGGAAGVAISSGKVVINHVIRPVIGMTLLRNCLRRLFQTLIRFASLLGEFAATTTFIIKI